MDCITSRDVWGQCSNRTQKNSLSYKSIKELPEEMFMKLNKEEMEELLVVLWKLWKINLEEMNLYSK